MKTVAIVGLGLIGGSFGLALREADFTGEVLGVSSDRAIAAGLRLGAISRRATLEEAASTADLIYLAQPVDRILETLEMLGPLLRARSPHSACLVTDAGSTKAVIVQKACECLPAGMFLGGHPMAGKEKRGVEAAEADLFRGRRYVLTPTADETALSREFRLWLSRMGAQLVQMSAPEHDATVAFTSHLPQLLSTALAGTLARQNNRYVAEVYGSGLLDMTRLALSPADLWLSIFHTNQGQVISACDQFIDCLKQLRESILAGDPVELMEVAGRFADNVGKPRSTN